jgi:RHS repeat-associated protein
VSSAEALEGPRACLDWSRRRPCEGIFPGADPEHAGIYLRARYFDPQRGTFLNPDPIGVAGGMNAYAYGFGDPVNGTDRSGLTTCGVPEGGVDGTETTPCEEQPGSPGGLDPLSLVRLISKTRSWYNRGKSLFGWLFGDRSSTSDMTGPNMELPPSVPPQERGARMPDRMGPPPGTPTGAPPPGGGGGSSGGGTGGDTGAGEGGGGGTRRPGPTGDYPSGPDYIDPYGLRQCAPGEWDAYHATLQQCVQDLIGTQGAKRRQDPIERHLVNMTSGGLIRETAKPFVGGGPAFVLGAVLSAGFDFIRMNASDLSQPRRALDLCQRRHPRPPCSCE